MINTKIAFRSTTTTTTRRPSEMNQDISIKLTVRSAREFNVFYMRARLLWETSSQSCQSHWTLFCGQYNRSIILYNKTISQTLVRILYVHNAFCCIPLATKTHIDCAVQCYDLWLLKPYIQYKLSLVHFEKELTFEHFNRYHFMLTKFLMGSRSQHEYIV